MSIWLQKSASIQPRTSLSKFAKNWPKVRLKVRPNIGQRTAPDQRGCSGCGVLAEAHTVRARLHTRGIEPGDGAGGAEIARAEGARAADLSFGGG